MASDEFRDSEIYAKYKDTRNAAWKTLINFGVNSLPVSVSKIIRKMNITIDKYSADYMPDVIAYCGLEGIAESNCALTVYTDSYNIFYNVEASQEHLRYFMAHELGHIILRHPMKPVKAGFFTAYYTDWNKNQKPPCPIENEADSFALRLLAPACVLAEISVISKDNISELCGIPETEAAARANRMKTLITRNKFMESSMEKKVLEQFDSFIKDYKNKTRN